VRTKHPIVFRAGALKVRATGAWLQNRLFRSR
jgi:hypothetical protein